MLRLGFLKFGERQFRPLSSLRSLFEGNRAMSFVLHPWQFWLIGVAGWINRSQQEAIEQPIG